ncbi:DUF4333 domain-containing protein [Mycolicibacterium goodii]|uniref:DUF4333 domain-containing protein n=1 Tax=Mycolicibacterium goodii TaxID=134601 RepID=UPI001C20E61B|nr:DUF4333 domain-containing protein [Mycolicibacterium goodii]
MSGPERPWWVKPGGAPPPPSPPRPAARQPAPPRPGTPPRRTAQQAPHPNPYGPVPQHRAAARPTAPPPPRKRRAPAHWQAVAVAAAAVVVITAVAVGLWMRGESGGPRLDVRQAEAGVAEILTDPVYGYGANDVAAVACNNGKNPRVEAGSTFMCAVDINGTVRQVVVEFTDDDGTYAVDGPR